MKVHDKMVVELTKEEAVDLHRKLWHKIADIIEAENEVFITKQKKKAFEYFGWPTVMSDCWCCEYANTISNDCCVCDDCPIIWPGSRCSLVDSTGLYTELLVTDSPKKAAALARVIAELPEK